jgi:hypothetical protein
MNLQSQSLGTSIIITVGRPGLPIKHEDSEGDISDESFDGENIHCQLHVQ